MSASAFAVSRPLLVTVRDDPGSGWADVAHSAGMGLALWRERRHATVFADFGGMGSGISGVQLARVLRSQSAGLRIYLLSDRVHASQRVWARANGADDVILRSASRIADCLSGLYAGPAPSPHALPEGFDVSRIPTLRHVVRPLQL